MKYALVGSHPSIQKIRDLITMVSDTPFNVLIMGETGTGKEVVARLLHYGSSRHKKDFVKVNCPALPYTLLESELFGYEKGAFTGAVSFKPGRFELASGGVIFLDEIGDMPAALQAKLLEVLQSGQFNRLGGTREIKANAWVIAATNHDLENDMKGGLFREDLYYRLNIIKIEIPPLRERRPDIPLLTEHFIQKHRRDLKVEEPFILNEDLRELFQWYYWPGNVRELSNTVLMLMLGADPERVKSELFDNMIKEDGLSPPPELIGDPAEESVQQGGNAAGLLDVRPLKELKAEATKHVEKKAITHALELAGWNKREAARMLKISYKALFYKMANAGIEKNQTANNINDKVQNYGDKGRNERP